MKLLTKIISVVCISAFVGGSLYAQDAEQKQKVYLGPGFGFDYGGIGGKIEYLPVKHFGAFAGLGYNFLSVGWNIGATYKILPDKKVSPNLMVMYGYNAVLTVSGASQYDKTSYGVTFGANIDIMLGKRGNKLSAGIFVPIRSSSFWDNYDAAKANPNISFSSELLPIGFSIGYNFLL